jgi:cell division protein FtsB
VKIPAHIKYIVVSVLLLAGSVNMIRTTKTVMQSSKRLDREKKEVLALRDHKADLVQDIEYKKTAEYAEEVARNSLNMIKPGEEVYIYPQNTPTEGSESVEQEMERTPTNQREKTPLQEWVDLFF